MESSGSLSSSTTKPENAGLCNVSLAEKSHGILRRPAVSVSPNYDHDRMMAVANVISIGGDLREQNLRSARERFSPSAVKLIGEDRDWDRVDRGAFKFRCPVQVTYFIGHAEHGIKIGVSLQPIERLAILQTGSPVPLRILACIEGGMDLEKGYHTRFREHRLHGEWFSPHPEILAEIDRINSEQAA